MAEAENDTVTISKDLLSRLINIANPTAPGGVDIVNEAIRTSRGPLPATEDYFVLYRVTWQPEKVGDDGPMDRAHTLMVSDTRYEDHEMVEIGSLYNLHSTVNRLAVNDQADLTD